MLSSYIFTLILKPTLEIDNMEAWDISFTTVMVRVFLLYAMPVLFHSLDITFNSNFLITSYQTKQKKMMFIWSLLAYSLYTRIFYTIYPNNDSIDLLKQSTYFYTNRIVTILVTCFGFAILYSTILKKAYIRKIRSRSISNGK